MQRTTGTMVQPQDALPDRVVASRRPSPLHQRAKREDERLAAAVEVLLRFVEEMRGRAPPAA
jgi:hypothetical protein